MSSVIERYASNLNAAPLRGALKAPANLDDMQTIAFIDQDLHRRAGVLRPEFIYRHRWRQGDVLIWTRRLTLTA